jgi:anti-sigma regulatory factor (Ser/Thr protein kinase)
MSSAESPAVVVLERNYGGSSSSLRTTRRDVVSCLEAHSVGEDLRGRAELVISELASNAIQASPGIDYGVRVSLGEDAAVVIAVTSCTDGRGPPPREEWGPAHARAPRGRGLLIVGELTDHVAVDRSASHTIVVTATFLARSPV